ncbi:MAG: hypothetical protein L6R40_003081 [Gallowayella cf. fulva]|nr:MAG: hypothetical protein L6R40_003081 [Xanthomendoza cf. fulva]
MFPSLNASGLSTTTTRSRAFLQARKQTMSLLFDATYPFLDPSTRLRPRRNAISPLPASAPNQPDPFMLMKLPLEVRRNIYSFALPVQDTAHKSTDWATIVAPNDDQDYCMNLLLSNKTVSHEAREVLYGHKTFTVVLRDSDIFFLGRRAFSAVEDKHGDSFALFPSSPSMEYIKNWQVVLELRYGHPHNDEHIRESVLGMSEALGSIEGLETLKVGFPCLCSERHAATTRQSSDRRHRYIRATLQPLMTLRFHSRVVFIAAAAAPPRLENDREPAPRGFFQNSSTHYPHQCQEPECLGLVASLDDLQASLTSSPPRRVGFTDPQRQWLDVKRRAAAVAFGVLLSCELGEKLRALWRCVEATTTTMPDDCCYHPKKPARDPGADLKRHLDGTVMFLERLEKRKSKSR